MSDPRTIAIVKLALRDVVVASGVSAREIVFARRGRREAWLARHVWWWLARKLSGASYPEIGRLAGRWHMPILFGVRKIERSVAQGDGDVLDLLRRVVVVAQARMSRRTRQRVLASCSSRGAA